MTSGDQAILNMLIQIQNTLLALKKSIDNGVKVKTQESHTP